MTINLINNTSDKRVINKSLQTVTENLNCQLIDNVSLIRPSFIMSNTADNRNVNYCYVPDFSRYYFIDNIVILDRERIQLNCSIDVLETYKTDILGLEVILSRSQTKVNTYLNDDRNANYAYRQMQTKIVSGTALRPSQLTSSSYCFALTVSGGV